MASSDTVKPKAPYWMLVLELEALMDTANPIFLSTRSEDDYVLGQGMQDHPAWEHYCFSNDH